MNTDASWDDTPVEVIDEPVPDLDGDGIPDCHPESCGDYDPKL